jgi:hypothetical protein
MVGFTDITELSMKKGFGEIRLGDFDKTKTGITFDRNSRFTAQAET